MKLFNYVFYIILKAKKRKELRFRRGSPNLVLFGVIKYAKCSILDYT